MWERECSCCAATIQCGITRASISSIYCETCMPIAQADAAKIKHSVLTAGGRWRHWQYRDTIRIRGDGTFFYQESVRI